jgi:4a-hydroxytetrahydrobiopterin dehydratase
MQHHPDICISYNSVVCMVTTHEKEGLTEADFKLVKAIEKEADDQSKEAQELN